MSEAEAGTTKQPDPMEKLRELRDAYLDVWSKNLIETVNSEDYAKASGAALDGILAVAGPFKEPTEQAMLKTLQQFNLPTSADFASLAGRFTNVEMLLDNLDAKLDRIEKLFTGSKATTPAPAKTPVESAAHTASVHQVAAKFAGRPVRAVAPRSARKIAPKKQTALRAGATSKRTTTAKPARHNPRKGTR
jgi:hypothetical protein